MTGRREGVHARARESARERVRERVRERERERECVSNLWTGDAKHLRKIGMSERGRESGEGERKGVKGGERGRGEGAHTRASESARARERVCVSQSLWTSDVKCLHAWYV